jgi:hypothetical protein
MSRRDSPDARQRRASALRARIADIIAGAQPPARPPDAPPPAESPREFVHRRMRELAAQEKSAGGGGSRKKAVTSARPRPKRPTPQPKRGAGRRR